MENAGPARHFLLPSTFKQLQGSVLQRQPQLAVALKFTPVPLCQGMNLVMSMKN
jgi:hypothetical protein